MADAKISALTAATGMTDDDFFVIVDDPSGTPVTKKMTRANFLDDSFVFNEGGGGKTFRVEGSGEANAFFVEGSGDNSLGVVMAGFNVSQVTSGERRRVQSLGTNSAAGYNLGRYSADSSPAGLDFSKIP